jgi:hypothetical protein
VEWRADTNPKGEIRTMLRFIALIVSGREGVVRDSLSVSCINPVFDGEGTCPVPSKSYGRSY